ncbi:MAG: RecQ family ATP-dependent DNA helicase [Myxococcota bacterium]
MGDLDRRLEERFGLPAFRPWQEEAVREVLEGSGRVLVVAPTGGGKSLCYQFPASELPGTTVVISPLIALMEDQVRSLQERSIAATFLASSLDRDERLRRERALAAGRYRLVYVAPEALASDRVLALLASLSPPLVAIDEAHCISQWGHDFRPDYLRLGGILARLAPPRTVACTATATPVVRDEILQRLGLDPRGTRLVLRGFARPNLHLSARHVERPRDRRNEALAALARALGEPQWPRGGAIVYAGTRKGSERMAQEAERAGWRAAAYHAGLPPEERADVSRRFAARELHVVAATTAFGMGIDRPDIRLVVHTQAPGSIEELYQEVGRAGRDGQEATGLLLTSSTDFGLRRRLIEGNGGDGAANRERAARQWALFLDLMRYVEAGSCRHDFILRYFGDEQETLGGCGHCDVCERLERRGEGADERAVTEEDALVVRKALSGVARAQGRAGLRAVADMLRGVRSARQRKLGLEALSTHGVLAERSDTWILALLRRLLTAGLVDLEGERSPVVRLTPRGVLAMKGEAPVRLLLPEDDDADADADRRQAPPTSRRPASAPGALARLDAADAALFEALRAERRRLAQERGLPAYMVCHDRTLAHMASDRPTTRAGLATVHGMGPARLERWGDALLAVIRRHAQGAPSTDAPD